MPRTALSSSTRKLSRFWQNSWQSVTSRSKLQFCALSTGSITSSTFSEKISSQFLIGRVLFTWTINCIIQTVGSIWPKRAKSLQTRLSRKSRAEAWADKDLSWQLTLQWANKTRQPTIVASIIMILGKIRLSTSTPQQTSSFAGCTSSNFQTSFRRF